jgi:Tol biopolymer transport system component
MRFVLASLFLLVGCGSSAEKAAATDSGTDTAVVCRETEVVDAATDPPPHPTPEELSFQAINALPAGEQLLFNDWTASPNAVYSMRPDGTGETEIFRVHRVWAMALSHAGDKLAFSSADPKQEERYGLTIGDAIQHTWMYDVATQKITALTKGNVNDECHAFSPDDKTLYVCRRYDFAFDGMNVTNKGWRITALDLASGAGSYLSPIVDREFHLGPQPSGGDLFYSITNLEGTSQKFRIVKTSLPCGGETTLVRADASRPSLSPDGKKYAYSNPLDKGALYVSDVGSTASTKVSSTAGTEVRWSPDGTRIAFLRFDNALNCSHIEIARADGTDADATTRVYTCSTKFLSELAWIKR